MTVHDFATVPEGSYTVRVREVREGRTRAGDTRWGLALEVVDGDFAGRLAAWDAIAWSVRGEARAPDPAGARLRRRPADPGRHRGPDRLRHGAALRVRLAGRRGRDHCPQRGAVRRLVSDRGCAMSALAVYRGRGLRLVCDVVREPGGPRFNSPLRSGSDVVRVLRLLQRAGRAPVEREAFLALLLNGRHVPHVASVGTLMTAPVHPREVFRPAIAAGAAAIVVAHNHPSGDASPSPDDRTVTERLRQVGELVGIEVLDHVVVGAERFYSFADESFHDCPPEPEREP